MPVTLSNLLIVAVGGAIGSALRYGLSGMAYRLLGTSFPWGTLLVNLVGCFFIGLIWGIAEHFPLRPKTTLLIVVGVLGAFTTFSTYALESTKLFRDGETALAVANIAASNFVGLLVVFLGFGLARLLLMALGLGGES